jgi:hypothetical protein
MCKLTRIYVLAYAQATSLSRGAEIAQFLVASLCSFVELLQDGFTKTVPLFLGRLTSKCQYRKKGVFRASVSGLSDVIERDTPAINDEMFDVVTHSFALRAQ